MNRYRPSRLVATLATVGVVGVCAVVQASSASAASISRVKFASATHSSITVTVTGHASRYQLYVAQVHHQLTSSNLHNDPHSAWSKGPNVTVSGLHYSTTPWFFRVVGKSGSGRAYSAEYGPVGLKPSTPTNVAVSIAHGAVSLHWSGGAGTGYVVERSPTANFASVSRSYTLIGPGQQFTPPDLTNGTPYYFRVRAVNTGTKSSPSAAVAGNNSVGTTPITTVTYNIREASLDSQPDGKNHGAPWDQRKGPEASLLRTASPDVVAIEEGASYVDGSSTERQADSLTAALGNPYAIANTEIPAPQKHHFRTGDYIIYNSNTVQPIGQGGHWDLGEANLGHQHWAAYQEFRCVGTGAKFLFVAFHLVVVNNGVTDDRARQRQTESMIQQAESFAAGPNLPIVYAGDTNSAVESSHPLDGPRVAMRAHQIADAFDVAASRHHTQYNTGNQYYPKPPASHIYLDAIFAEPGVGVASWDELLKLSHGRFVLPIPSDHNPVVARLVIPG